MGGPGDKIGSVYFVTAPGSLRSVYLWINYRWTYFLRTVPDIEDLLAPLECAIDGALILSIAGQNCTQAEHMLLAVKCKMYSYLHYRHLWGHEQHSC